MNRRTFLKILAAAGIAPIMPQVSSLTTMYKNASAAIDYSKVNINAGSVPSVMPQVINLFLYGGPSELAGNLTNIVDIEQNSQTKYTDFFPGIVAPQATATGGQVTPRGFWGSNDNGAGSDAGLGAGGDDMEFLVNEKHMSVYRTMMSRKNTSQSHRENILKSQKGSLDIEASAGLGNKLASIISNYRGLYVGKSLADGTVITDVEELNLPFVSILDGDTRVFDKGDSGDVLPLLFNGISVNEDLSNPFTRDISNLGTGSSPLTDEEESALLDDLVKQSLSESSKDFSEVIEAFELRGVLADRMSAFNSNFGVFHPLSESQDINANGGTTISYPDTGVGRSLQAAVTLAIENPSTLFITLGGAFGGWDDHNNGVDRYPRRMREVFEALRVAMMHIKYSDQSFNTTPISGLSRNTNNIIINVFGDFGRRVNLNSSLGWNHGNNQNFYTLGGSAPGLRTAAGSDALGKVVGTTVRVGDAGDDQQFTEPADGSYEFEPISVAANIFKHFGVDYPAEVNQTTPDPLTAVFDPDDPSVVIDPGSPPIDETQT